MVGAGGTQTSVHLHVSCLLYHCAMDADWLYFSITAQTAQVAWSICIALAGKLRQSGQQLRNTISV